MSMDSGANPFFKPLTKAGTVQVAFSAASTSANVALPTTTPGGAVLRIWNNSPVTMYVNWDTSNAAAAAKATAYPVPSNAIEYIRLPDDVTYTYFAAIPDASTTGTVFVTVGTGAA